MRKAALTTMMIVMVCALVLVAFTATATAKAADRPFSGLVIGKVSFTPDGGLGPSPSPTGLWTVSSAAGISRPLGGTVMMSHHPTPPGDNISDGLMTLVAANGDKVSIQYTGYAPFPIPGVTKVIVVDVDFTIVGGTGHFAHASGGGDMTAYIKFPGNFTDPNPWPAVWYWQGTIRY